MLEIALEADEEWDSSTGWDALVRKAAEAAVAESAFPQLATPGRAVELSVRLTSDSEVRALNAEWRGKDRPTNVLSFPLAEPTDLQQASVAGPELLLGDIVLARGVCTVEAAEKQVPVADHAAHLVVHGTLHLLGYDHGDDGSAEDMEAREVRALARLGIANPYEVAG
ncbi:MAG: Metal-dependent hydrolase YbeY, involved in rRNA and/or ribosome maturation and assembly [uncultured Sphingomonas sp.]|uniref:Endoribonuclease YbeY n=1 Tax=uncultured Sphingomonas sp. TaxID=158754 RepID=A0A6J4SHD3_9SPHN|nr:MAG: Metal-dependent hydrolase YbeY, involved in rRNA and/or ribosome maturation and assembly [uncultured Sphingomonas sp.]